ncbi:MAG: hypothetical protein ABI605_20725 [Rhizobacter sp.]
MKPLAVLCEGDIAEARLSTALGYRNTGNCTPAVATSRDQALSVSAESSTAARSTLVRSPLRQNRLYRER